MDNINNQNIEKTQDEWYIKMSKLQIENTEEPTSEKPATEEPVTEEPVTEEPLTEEPVTEELITNHIVEENKVLNDIVKQTIKLTNRKPKMFMQFK